MVWKPGKVSAQVFLPITGGPPVRSLIVNTNSVTDNGNIKPVTVQLEVEASASGMELKQMLAAHPGSPADAPERMVLLLRGTELSDDEPLSSAAPTAPEVEVTLLIRRRQRGALTPRSAPTMEPSEPLMPQRKTLEVTDAAGDGTSVDHAKTANSSVVGYLRTLVVRSMTGVGRAATIDGLDDGMDVSELRALVASMPLALQAWKASLEGDEAGAADAKKAPAKDAKDTKPVEEDEGLPLQKLLLLGVGIDLELAADEQASTATEAKAPPSGLVHLRDGRKLSEYHLEDGSIIYLVIEK